MSADYLFDDFGDLPSSPAPLVGEGDASTRDGAHRLKKKIEDYWGARGYAVQVAVIPHEFVQAMRSRRYEIKSDLVNGWPRPIANDRSQA